MIMYGKINRACHLITSRAELLLYSMSLKHTDDPPSTEYGYLIDHAV